MLINREKIAFINNKKAISQCVKLIGLKNYETINHIRDNIFSHTNTRGRTRYFLIFNACNNYFDWRKKEFEHKFHRVNGYYIAELDSLID